MRGIRLLVPLLVDCLAFPDLWWPLKPAEPQSLVVMLTSGCQLTSWVWRLAGGNWEFIPLRSICQIRQHILVDHKVPIRTPFKSKPMSI